MAGVVQRVAGGTGYKGVLVFSASVIGQLVFIVFIFHWYGKILSTGIIIK